ncbi:MAG: type II secretion system protein GspG [Bryobacterales bacterium]|nr:type II secretion system protein GspG [Bryobacterales bacterium]
MDTCRVFVAIVLIAAVAGLVSGCRHDVDYLPAERAERNEIVSALEVFRKDTGRYPTVHEGLEALLRDPGVEDWRGPSARVNGFETPGMGI